MGMTKTGVEPEEGAAPPPGTCLLCFRCSGDQDYCPVCASLVKEAGAGFYDNRLLRTDSEDRQ